jgi:hypothetical protein
MREKLLLTASVIAITAVSFLWFPGHTILQSDTQIYIPILEQLRDPAALTRDIVASNPHVTYTVYDEMALLLRRVTGLGFEPVLMGEQIVYRAIGVIGLLLIGLGTGLSPPMAVAVAGIVSLGANVNGPAVLTVEYEPVPRGFALPFLLLSLGLAANGRPNWAALSAGVAFLFHPPTALAFCCVLGLVFLWQREWRGALILIASAMLMAVFAWSQPGVHQHQDLFGRIDPELEKLQRMRASYNWVSVWIGRFWGHYLFLWTVGLAAYFRIRNSVPPALRVLFTALPAIGAISVPVSYLLTEQLRWSLMPQFQPARYLLFITLFAMLLSAIAAVKAGRERRWMESALFFAVAFAPAMAGDLFTRGMINNLPLLTALALIAMALAAHKSAVATVMVLPFLLIPTVGKVQNYAPVHTAELNAVAQWARASTPQDAMFQFANFGQQPEPGIFRARSVRALYVDWKSGGQVNFMRQFADEWWYRFQKVQQPLSLTDYKALGVDFVVFKDKEQLKDFAPVYENARYVVYRPSNLHNLARVFVEDLGGNGGGCR